MVAFSDVELIPFYCLFEVIGIKGPYVPRYVVAPSRALDPMNCASIEENEITRLLRTSKDWNTGILKFFKIWPPGTREIIDLILLAHLKNNS